MFNEYLFHLCDCTCSNVMCVCSTICESNQKDFCSFCLLLEVICITHIFQILQIVFVWKTFFLGVFVTHFMCKLSWELNGPILKFFSFTQRVSQPFRGCFASKAYPRKISRVLCELASHENFQISILKGILWDICFKCLSYSPKPLFLIFLHQNSTKFKCFSFH